MHTVLVRHRHIGVYERIAKPWVRIFDILERLEELHSHETSFCKGILLSQTDSWPSVEGHILPAPHLTAFPPLRHELSSIRTPKICAAMHGPDGIADSYSLGNEYRRRPIRATSDGYCCVLQSCSRVKRNRWVHTQSFIENISKICYVFQRRKGDFFLRFFDGAELAHNLIPKFGPHSGIWASE